LFDIPTVNPLLVTLIVGFLAAFFAIRNDVDRIIDQKIDNDEFMAKLVARLRPSVVFDQYKKIYADTGTMDYITDFQIETNQVTTQSHGQIDRPRR
jgi:hypothetical protein